MKIPGLRSDASKVRGLVYFGRMLDKIRLKASGSLPHGYITGTGNPTYFDSRCTAFLKISYDDLVNRTLAGGTDEEILDWCYSTGQKPTEVEIEVWNGFMQKKGWRDDESEELANEKSKMGFSNREDIQTWFDLHRAEES